MQCQSVSPRVVYSIAKKYVFCCALCALSVVQTGIGQSVQLVSIKTSASACDSLCHLLYEVALAITMKPYMNHHSKLTATLMVRYHDHFLSANISACHNEPSPVTNATPSKRSIDEA